MSYGQQRPHCKAPYLLFLLLMVYSQYLPCCFVDVSEIVPASQTVMETCGAVIDTSCRHACFPAYAGRIYPLRIEQKDKQTSCVHNILMAVLGQNKF